MLKKPSKTTRKPSVSIVGSGRLGTALAIALSTSGYRIQAVVARHRARARKAAAQISSATLALKPGEWHKLPASKIVLIATPDDQIASTARQLASLRPVVREQVVLHTSGALSSDALAPLAAIGVSVGSLHPLVSVSDPRTGSKNLRGAFYCVEGEPGATRVARSIVRDLKGHSFSIQSKSKPLYHAAAVMASGHVVALIDLASELLVQCGLSPKTARRVLLPLLQSTVDNLSKSDPSHALTGTFARRDLATVERHLETLSAHGLRVALETYKILGARSLELAKENSTDPEIVTRIRRALSSSGRKK